MIAPLFNCSQPVMYQTSKTLWLNCKKFITEMGAFKGFYTEDYCDERIAEIEAAEAMKGEAARALKHENLRIELEGLAEKGRENWQSLKQYISTVYKNTEVRANHWRAAGWQYYDKAGDNNWASVTALLNAGLLYINENLATLTANNNMPPTFVVAFTGTMGSFNLKLADFTQAEEDSETETNAKNNANNDVYQKAIDMGQDGQHVMRNDDAKRKQFSFDAVSSLIEPAGSATTVVELRNAETNAVIPVFEMTNLETNRTVAAVGGRAEMGQQAAGSTQYRIAADGFPEEVITVDVKTGTKSIYKLELTPIIGEAAMAEIAETHAAPVAAPVVVG